MGWLYLVLAIVFETTGTACLKMSDGFSVLMPSLYTVVSYILCFMFLSFALKTIDMSIAYAIWGAFGILLISAIGMFVFHESITTMKVISILLIIAGTVGLKLAS